MPMYLRLSIPPEVDEQITVRNEGHPVTQDHPEDDDRRVYLVTTQGGSIRFRIEHHRGDGRHRLAALALQGVSDRVTGIRQRVIDAAQAVEQMDDRTKELAAQAGIAPTSHRAGYA